MGIGATDFIRLLVGKLTFDRVRMPFAALVEQNRGCRSEAVDRDFGLVVAESSERGVQCVVDLAPWA